MKANKRQGFALIVTLLMMVLLTVIAVGLLTLSSVTLRSSKLGDAVSIARANARMALILSIGDLQKATGPDTSITATGNIIDDRSPTKSHLTGAWTSWKIDPSHPPTADEYAITGKRTTNFQKWLVSSANPVATESIDYVKNELPENEKITFVPRLGNGSTASESVTGGLVKVDSNPSQNSATGRHPAGAFAYVVLDDGVKARIDTGYRQEKSTNLGDLAATLATGVRADASRIAGLEKIDWEISKIPNNPSTTPFMLDKVISYSTGGLLVKELSGANGTSYNDLFHDVTTESVGLFTDAANGGLKQDLNSILNASTLTQEFSPTLGLYTSQNIAVAGNPIASNAQATWGQVFDFANFYNNGKLTDATAPTLSAQGLYGWTSTATSPSASSTAALVPALVRLQIYYSIMFIPITANRAPTGLNESPPANNSEYTQSDAGNVNTARIAWRKGARYHLILVISPVVTIHNPYNTTLRVADLGVEISNVPMSLEIKRQSSNAGASSGWLPAGGQGVDNIDSDGANFGNTSIGRKFSLGLCDDVAGYNTEFKLAPGEVRTFSPAISPTAQFGYNGNINEYNKFQTYGGGYMRGYNGKIPTLVLAKGNRGVNNGYFTSRLGGGDMPGYESGRSIEYAGPDDTITLRIRPCIDKRINGGNLSIAEQGKTTMTLVKFQPQNANSAPIAREVTQVYSKLKLDFGSTDTDGNLLTRFEKTQRSQGIDVDDNLIGPIKVSNYTAAIGNTPLTQINSYTFAISTISTKTSLAQADGTNSEGLYPAKPFSFHSELTPETLVDVSSELSLSSSPLEANIIKLGPDFGNDYTAYLNSNSVGLTYGITGLSSNNVTGRGGVQFGTIYGVPTGPLQSFPQLNGSNLATNSSLARFTYPIGNSWAHPAIPPNSLTASAMANGVASYDHSFLLNSIFFDKFYFSGIAPRTGDFGSGMTAAALAKEFIKGASTERNLDPRLISYLPDGTSQIQAIDVLKDSSKASNQAAGHQAMKGLFNVNSTSVNAWKAMLSSIHAPDAQMYQTDTTNPFGKLADLPGAASTGSARFSRFSLPNSSAPADGDDKQKVFQGPRDISDTELETLAVNIVSEIKKRGPFLSMSEFVNRRIGSDAFSKVGALQAAIDASEINGDDSVLEKTGYSLSAPPLTAGYTNPEAMIGRSDQGAPGFLTQADLLTTLGNAANVRSDTFTIRAYGDSRDANGQILARVWCEAVVQRVPDFVNSTNKCETPINDPTLTSVNKTFGRRYVIRSFRYMLPDEIEQFPSGN